jgi:hypothetical protein
VVAVIDTILERDKAVARISPTVEAADVMLAISMLAVMLSKSDADDRPATAARGRAIFRAAFAYQLDPRSPKG